MPDLQCTFFPDVWFGVSLTPCCIAHDLSPLDTASSIELARCVVARMGTAHPVAGIVLAGLMAAATAVWCGIKYGVRGKTSGQKKEETM